MDVVIVGAGVLGLAVAHTLLQHQPELRVLIIEQDGVPSEQGSTYLSPGIMYRPENAADASRYEQTLNTIKTLPQQSNTRLLSPCGYIRFQSHETPQSTPATTAISTYPDAEQQRIHTLLNTSNYPHAYHDPAGGYVHAEALALRYGRASVHQGATLMLNSRVINLNPLTIERLEFDRMMQRVVIATERVTCEQLVLAAGVNNSALLEESYGFLDGMKRSYRQFLRIETDAHLHVHANKLSMPVLELAGVVLRAQGEGVLVSMPLLPADPEGYVPQGGKLLGVPVGVRREYLEYLLQYEHALPFVAWSSLNLGKTLNNVRSGWDVHTTNGATTYLQVPAVNATVYALYAGQDGIMLALSKARDLAKQLTT